MEPTFQDYEFMTAHEKRAVLQAWRTFLKNGLQEAHFTKAIYRWCIGYAAFIAHYDRGGFYATYFHDPDDTLRFLDQFDPRLPGVSVEYGDVWWQRHDGMADLIAAVREETGRHVERLRRDLTAKRLERAERAAADAAARVARLRGVEPTS